MCHTYLFISLHPFQYMQVTLENFLLIGSALLFVSILISKTGYRFGIPVLLLFLFVGMLFGSDGLGIQFENAESAQFIGMIALSIILFSGGMDTKLEEVRPVMGPGVLLSTAGVLLTTLFTGGFIYLISGLPGMNIELTLVTSMLLAATMSSTDSASVFNILRSQQIRLKNHLRPLLELESGSNDPMAYLLTIVLIALLQTGGTNITDVVILFFVQFIVGALGGYLLGRAVIWILNHIKLPNSTLYPILLLSLIFIIFTLVDTIGGNGYLAVYIAGIIVGNRPLVYRRDIQSFMGGMTWLFQIVMFLTLGLLVNPHEMINIALAASLIGVFMILVARPLSVVFCLLPFKGIKAKSGVFISWVGLRGAAPIIFATYPVIARVEGSDQLFNIVFFITILSLIIQGTTVGTAARWLGLVKPPRRKPQTFGLELPEEADASLNDYILTANDLIHGNTLKEVELPTGTLVLLIKRDERFIIPNGQVELKPGDHLLMASENKTVPAD